MPIDLASIVRVKIHPSIGVARVGNALEEFFCGPEVTDPAPEAPGFYRDPKGGIKRQAARFRVYGYDKDDKAVAELTPDIGEIAWTVHLANKKADWYQFQVALDIPEVASAPPSLRRNGSVPDRSQLVIDSGPRKISGRKLGQKPEYVFGDGRFMGKQVYLGEIRTDDAGRLVVLGGHGQSFSHAGLDAVDFGNNDGWCDDVSDGPVTAVVKIGGRTLEADPAWVVVAPPNYAPGQKSICTMWDLMRDTAIRTFPPVPDKLLPHEIVNPPSFNTDIRPIFERLTRLQWVNAGLAASFGWGGPNDFTTQAWLTQLSNTTDTYRQLRWRIFSQFRDRDRDGWSPVPWPWVFGDAFNVPTKPTPRAFATLTATQMAMLRLWADGKFTSDYDPKATPPATLEAVPVDAQPTMLDRASLEFCVGEVFHPGCELPWIVRQGSVYMAPFRLAHAAPGKKEGDYGPQISSDNVGANPPFAGQFPGGLTRWMAVPWQTDSAACRSGYGAVYGPNLPTFWPARVPNQVLTLENYNKVMDKTLSFEDRMKAFATRSDWLYLLRPPGKPSPPFTAQINSFIAQYADMTLVETRPGPKDEPRFPGVIEVEDQPRKPPPA